MKKGKKGPKFRDYFLKIPVMGSYYPEVKETGMFEKLMRTEESKSVCTDMHTYMYTIYIYTQVHTGMHTCIHTGMHIQTPAHNASAYMFMYTMHRCTHVSTRIHMIPHISVLTSEGQRGDLESSHRKRLNIYKRAHTM